MMYRGTIVEPLANQRAWVRVPALAGQDPLDVPVVPYDLLPGEGVLVGDLGARGLDLVVIGREIELQRFPEWGDIVDKPATFPPSSHTHDWADVSGKPATFPPSAHGHTWGEISGAPATYPPSAHSHSWDSVTDKPAVFPPQGHVHGVTDISDSTTIGRGLVIAQTAAAARTVIGAGTSSLALGTTAGTAMEGNKTFTKADVGLGSVDNTSDAAKVASGPIKDALDTKAASGHTHTYGFDPTVRDVTFSNSWSNFNAAADYGRLRTVATGPGAFTLSGMPKPGTISEGIVIGAVHADHRPTRHQYMACVSRTTVPSQVQCMIVIRHTTGNIELYGMPSTTSYLAIGLSYVKEG